MDLLIRSQDKKQLLKVNDGLYIANGFTDTDDSFIGIKNVGHVGRYKTEERALEVLDEIQNKINNYESELYACKNIYVGDISYPTYIYEMPKE